MAIPKIKYQQLTLTVATAGQIIPIDAETDKLYTTVTGINAVLTDENAMFGKLQLGINGLEVFPERFEILRVLFRAHAPFGFDYHTLNEPASGSKITGSFTDNNASSPAYPYTVILSFRLENLESTDAGKID